MEYEKSVNLFKMICFIVRFVDTTTFKRSSISDDHLANEEEFGRKYSEIILISCTCKNFNPVKYLKSLN